MSHNICLDDLKPYDLDGHFYYGEKVLEKFFATGVYVSYWPPRLHNWRRLEKARWKAWCRSDDFHQEEWDILADCLKRDPTKTTVIVEPVDRLVNGPCERFYVYDGNSLTTRLTAHSTLNSCDRNDQPKGAVFLNDSELNRYWHCRKMAVDERAKFDILDAAFKKSVEARLHSLVGDFGSTFRVTNCRRDYVVAWKPSTEFIWVMTPEVGRFRSCV